MNEHLMQALLYAALFLETSSDAECDLDLSAKQLEHIADALTGLTPSEQAEFRSYAYGLAAKDPSPVTARQIRTLINGLLPDADD